MAFGLGSALYKPGTILTSPRAPLTSLRLMTQHASHDL
jgi:hypothetical protein